LEGMADWMDVNSPSIHDVEPVPEASPSGEGDGEPWVRWTGDGKSVYAVVDAAGRVPLRIDAGAVDVDSATILGGGNVVVEADGDMLTAEIPATDVAGPQVVRFARH
ncbi:alpha-L-fucosidase, partial [Bifidobacterium longum]|nr:alpha-L-fucosidase [Bifidobacterium longum]